jgi:hypothetical protein
MPMDKMEEEIPVFEGFLRFCLHRLFSILYRFIYLLSARSAGPSLSHPKKAK